MNIINQTYLRTRDYLLKLPLITWVLMGFLVTFFFFFIGPIFLDPSHVMQFKPYVFIMQPIAHDFLELTSASRVWISTGEFIPTEYPPMTILLFAPFTLFTDQNGYRILLFLTISCYILITLILPQWIHNAKGISAFGMLIFVSGIVSYGLQFELERGQVDVITWALCLGAIFIFHRKPRLRWLAYLLFSISVQLKLYPSLLIFTLIDDWRDWKNNLKRFVGLGLLNILALFILGLDPLLKTITMIAGDKYIQLAQYFNLSISSFSTYILSLALGPHKKIIPLFDVYSWILQLALLALFVGGFFVIVRQAYMKNAKGFNPYVFLACTVAALIIPSASFDYRLSFLPATIAMTVPGIFSFEEGKNSFRMILLALLFSVGYSSTLYSFANKPAALQNNFPALILIMLCPVFACLTSDKTRAVSGDPAAANSESDTGIETGVPRE